MQTVLAILIAIVVLGGGYYWYTQNMTGETTQDEMTEPFGTAGESMNNNIPAGTMMEDGTIPEPSSSDAMMNNSGSAMTEGNDAMMEEESMSTVREFTVTGQNFSFSPSAITVKKGDRVKITFVNAGGTHDWRLEGYNVGTQIIQGGNTEVVEFVADKAGTFEFYCSVGSHRAMGMVGTLIVE